MKTKLSRFGRSSVSVILAVMMLLSTLLVGTVSTVNAADLSNATKVYLDSTVATVNNTKLSTWDSICAYAFNTSGVNTYTDQNTDGKNSWPGSVMYNEGNGIYSIYVDNSATYIIFNNNKGTQTGNLTLPDDWKTTPMIYCGDGSKGSNGWKTYSASTTYTVNYGVNGGNGTLTSNGVSSGSSVNSGTKVTFTATPNSGYEVEGWYSDSTCNTKISSAGTGTTYEVTVNAETNVYVKFKSSSPSTKDYYIRGSFNNWNVSDDYKMSYTDGVYSLTLTKMQASDYEFKLYYNDGSEHWFGTSEITNLSSEGCKLSGNGNIKISDLKEVSNITFTYDGDKTLTVVAESAVNKYTVTYTLGTDSIGKGSVTAKSGSSNISSGDSVAENSSVTFTATAKEGYKFDGWYSDADCTIAIPNATDSTYTTTVTDDTSVYANFVAVDYTVTYPEDTDAFTITDKSATTANVGDKVTFKVSAKTGYQIDSVEANSETLKDSNGSYTFTMPASKVTVTPTFTANNHNIAYDATVTGLESVDVKTSADFGDTVSVTVTAKSGYTVTGITVKETNGDGTVEVTTEADKYKFTMPDYDVTITPVIAVAEIAEPEVKFFGGAGESTASISANQLYPITAEATPAANSEIQSAEAKITSDNASDATLTPTETGYNFTSNVEGTFTIKYTVVAVSTLDSSKTSTVEKTITITTAFTETQKAYNTLKAYYETVKDPKQSDYSTDAYAALTAKLAEVKALIIDAGLPASDATDTEKYTTAKTELEKAVADKLLNFYIKGRFRIKNSSGSYVTINESSDTSVNDNFKFTSQGNGLYSLNTGCTLSELSAAISGSTGYQYFFVYNQENSIRYEPATSPEKADGKNNATDLNPTKSTSGWSTARFNSTDTSGTVTLWVDASGSTYKFYYTVAVEPKYALAGGLANDSWNTFDTYYLVSDETSYGRNVFSREISVTDTTYFNLINISNTRYGSSDNGTDEDMFNHSSQTSAYSTSVTTGNEGTALKIAKGKYILYVDQSGTTPKIWAEPVRDTKNVTFSVTGEGTGTVSINGTNVGETSVQAVEIGSSYTITLTPSADSYVESFKVGDTEVTSNTYTGTMPNEDVAVTVVFAKKSLHSVLVESDEGGAAEADITTAYSGQKVTVTVNADDDHVFDGISVKEKTSQDTVDCTENEDGTYTFVMPDDDVNVYAKFREKNTYTVTVVSANQQLGTVSIADTNETTAQVKEGDTVTIKATPIDPNSFDTWTLTGKYAFKGCTSNDAEATVVVNSDVKATASFTETAPYQVAYGSNGTLMRMNKTKYDGIYLSTATINDSTNFTIFNTAESTYGVIAENDTYYIKDGATSATINSWKTSYTPNSGCARNAYGKAKYVIYNANTKTITLTDDPDYGTKATLYVKNGTYSTSFDTGNTKDYAKSSVAAGLTATKTSPCNTYSVAFDTNVNVQTTLTDTYRKAGYYVGAYCVNGRNYTASAKDADQGIYQANITITEDLAENGVVEVTPVYYNRIIEQNGDYITFYVDADQAVSDWGNTIAVDAYCYVNGVQSNADHLFGTYPGQPMVRDGRYYVINVPRYRYYIGTDGSLVKDTNSPVSGVTLNNYNNESIHGGLVPIKRNMQTYDFSDFVKLANLDGVKTIMFQNQFYNATDSTAKRNMSVVYGVETSAVPSNAKKTISNIVNANVNPWQDFTDYYGRDTDALGNILSDEQKENDCLYIISTGSFNSTAYSTKGEWVTIWNVYDHDGNLVTYGTPADFLDSTTSQYQALNKDAYLGKPVKISYEKGQLYYDDRGKAIASRTDGRWYYSKLGQEFTSDVAIEYKYQGEETYTADTDSNAGNNTGFVGTTTKATATINNVTTASFSSVTETAHLNVKVSNGWRFDGWFIKQGDKYTKVSDNYTDISTDVLMSNSYHIVACISEIPSGTLELNHTAYTGTDPASHSGTGFYYISAVLYDQTGAVKHSYTETQGKISIDDFAATDSLEITLRAVAHGDNTIYAVYEGIDAGYFEIGEEDYKGDSSFSYTFKVSANSLFKDDKLAVNALNYYTDIVKVGGTCDITYKYKDRFGVEGEGNMVSYVVRNVELSTEEIVNKYQPSDDTITKYAPRIDTMYVDTKWVLTDAGKVEKGKSEATVIATQTNKTCKVYHPVLGDDGYYDTDIQDRTPYTVEFNSLLKDENGNFLLTTPEYNADKTLKFAYWEVYKVNKNGQSEGEVVTKCYERNFGLRIMADYYIVPVYSENVPDLTANINSPVLNREIYGDSANPTDKLYVDLLTAFTSTAIPTFKENTTDLSVECGVFVVRNNTSTLSVDDRNTLVNAAISNSTDTTSDILKGYIRDGAVEESLITKLGDLAKDSNVKDKTNTVANFGNDEYRITKLVFDNNSLTNKNRIDEVLKFTNNTANQNYIFTAYAFVVIKDSNGEVKDMCISESQYFNLCYVGNKALDNN